MRTLIIIFSLFLGFVAGWFAKDIYSEKSIAKISSQESHNESKFNALVNEVVMNELPNESGNPESATYSNVRFGFSVQYPAKLLFPQSESDNGDGQIFLSKNSEIELRVWGSNNAAETDIEKEFESESRGGIPSKRNRVITYKKLKDNWFVVSGYEDGNIFYQKLYLIDDHFVGLNIKYPESDRDVWDKKVGSLAAAFIPSQNSRKSNKSHHSPH